MPTHKLQTGQLIDEICLPNIDGQLFNSQQLQGKRYMLSFFRFASCPFCNLRIHQLVQDSKNWPQDFTVIAVFDSPLDNLQQHAQDHHAPFPILADANNTYYSLFGVEHSWLKTLKGALLRMPTLLYAMLIKGYWPTSFKGKLNTLPLDILVNEQGIIEQVYCGQDEGDHLALKQIRAFAQKDSLSVA